MYIFLNTFKVLVLIEGFRHLKVVDLHGDSGGSPPRLDSPSLAHVSRLKFHFLRSKYAALEVASLCLKVLIHSPIAAIPVYSLSPRKVFAYIRNPMILLILL